MGSSFELIITVRPDTMRESRAGFICGIDPCSLALLKIPFSISVPSVFQSSGFVHFLPPAAGIRRKTCVLAEYKNILYYYNCKQAFCSLLLPVILACSCDF
jgi:hypothetical protein